MRAALAAVLILCSAPLAQAQDRAVLEDARLAPVRARLEVALDAAASERLPTEWLLDKIAEGLSKHAAPPAIARAVETLLERMRAAERLAGGVPGVPPRDRRRLLRAAVDALAGGATERGLGVLLRDIARGDRAQAPASAREALVTVAELAERDFGGPAAVDATREAFQRGNRAGMRDLLSDARRIGPGEREVRDRALRALGRDSAPGQGRIDPPGHGRDHGSHGRGPR